MAKIETYNKLFDNIADAVRCGVSVRRDADAFSKIVLLSKPAVLRTYSDINNIVKAEWMLNGQMKLDRHKCGGCFAVAFEKRLIIKDDNIQYEYCREKIAIIAAMSIVLSFAKYEAMQQGNHKMIDYIKENGGLVIPGTSYEQKEYEELWAMELRRIYTREQEAEAALSIANRLFLIEEFNRERAKSF